MSVPCPDCGRTIGANRAGCPLCNRYGARLRAAVNRTLRDSDPRLTASITATLAQPTYDTMMNNPKETP